MKLPSKILSSILLASFSAFLIAGVPDPKPEKPPVQEKPNADLQAKAEAAIKTSVLDVLRNTGMIFSRSGLPQYTLNFTIAAPGEITATPDRLPFEIQRSRGGGKVNFLSGYYDAKAANVQLYDDATKSYAVAAEHPFIKRITPKPAPPAQPAQPAR